MSVTLRKRRRGDLDFLFLDIYEKGQRRSESLKLTLYPEPEQGKLTRIQKDHNTRNMHLAEMIKAKRWRSIQNQDYGLRDHARERASFLEFILEYMNTNIRTDGGANTWDALVRHIKSFTKGRDVTFADLSREWLNDFRRYLTNAKNFINGKPLAENSKYAYMNRLKTAVRRAYREGLIPENFMDKVDGLPKLETHREFLSLEELERLAQTPCYNEKVKIAFLFSALTGLRWSDVTSITWNDVRWNNELEWHIVFRQTKTKGAETHPISEEARRLLDGLEDVQGPIFRGITPSMTKNGMRNWIKRAGINRNITFHSARHTYATLLLSNGIDIYTVSKMLGHKDLKTTQVYAKIVDKSKKAAARAIVLKARLE